MKINRAQSYRIKRAISRLFDSAKVRLLGRYAVGPHILFGVEGYDPETSLEGVYRYSGLSYLRDFHPSDDSVTALAEVAGNYLDAEKMKAIAAVLSGIERAANRREAAQVLKDTFDRSKRNIELTTDTELQRAQVVANREGISQVASSVGVEDPTVAFLGRYDDRTCKYCRRMYHRQDNPAVPIVYRLSEVSGAMFKPKEWDGATPFFPQLHPRCRHVATFVAPGYGFDASGNLVFKGFDYDAVRDQGKIAKSEEPLGDCSCP